MTLDTILTHLSTSIKSSFNPKPIFKPTINLSILENCLQKCQNFKQFTQILSQMILTGFITDTFAASRLPKFSTDSLPFVDINYCCRIIFNSMMRAYIQSNSPEKVMYLYKYMLNNNVGVDNYTYPLLVQASALRLSVYEGKMVHGHVFKVGFDFDVYVNNTLINMYDVCGTLSDARKLFVESPSLDSVSWNAILTGYVNAGNVVEARYIFDRMPERNVIASNSMIVLFGRTGNVSEACKLFSEMPKEDLVSWSALISCYEQNEMYEEALVTFRRMNDHGVTVDEVVVFSALTACARLTDVVIGKLIHSLVVKIGVEYYVNLQNALIHMYSSCEEIVSARAGYNLDLISWNSMISGYLKCGSIEKAKALFDNMTEKDVVLWGAMMSGYAQHDRFSTHILGPSETKGAVAAASENAKNTNRLRNLNVLKADEYCLEQ